MWYVKDHYSNKIYFKSSDLRKCSTFANYYNKVFKFCGQRNFKFKIGDFSGISFFIESKIDVNYFTYRYSVFEKSKFVHPLSVKNFNSKHRKYVEAKVALIKKLCYKYHVWPRNEYGRKCDGFDF